MQVSEIEGFILMGLLLFFGSTILLARALFTVAEQIRDLRVALAPPTKEGSDAGE